MGTAIIKNMRVIAGMYRSRPLWAPKGMETRPTGDRLRERIFDILAPRIAGARVADLFAGSGAMGIEALSRGASFVLFVEKAPAALGAIRENLEKLGIGSGFRVAPMSVTVALGKVVVEQDGAFDIVFLDPPYEQAADYGETLHLLAQEADRLLAPNAVVVVEHRSSRRPNIPVTVADRYGKLRRYRVVEQGEAAVSFFRLEATAETG